MSSEDDKNKEMLSRREFGLSGKPAPEPPKRDGFGCVIEDADEIKRDGYGQPIHEANEIERDIYGRPLLKKEPEKPEKKKLVIEYATA